MISIFVIMYIIFISFLGSQKSKVNALYDVSDNKHDKTYLLSYPGICSEQKHIQQICSRFEVAKNHYNQTPKKMVENSHEYVYESVDNGDEDDSDDYDHYHLGFKYYLISLLIFTSISMCLIYLNTDKPIRRYDGKILPIYT